MTALGVVTGWLGRVKTWSNEEYWRKRWRQGAPDLRGIAVVVSVATIALGLSGDPFPVRLALVVLALAPWFVVRAARVPDWVAAATLIPSAVLFWRGDQFAAMFVLLLMVRVAAAGRRLPIALTLAAGLAVVIAPYVSQWSLGWAYWAGGLLFSLFGGWSFHAQRRLQDQLTEARAELDRRAFLEERRRIARDVHDLVAHSLTVVMLHLTAARLAVERDPAKAGTSLVEAEQLGRQALTEVRRLVELLGRDEDLDAGAPLPSVRDLPELIARLGQAGMLVELEMHGGEARLSPSASLALFRIGQEALSNAGRHAPGARVQVRLQVGGGEARLSVRNGAVARQVHVPAKGAGRGLAGMRQRADLLGGTLRAGPFDQGWQVECAIPA